MCHVKVHSFLPVHFHLIRTTPFCSACLTLIAYDFHNHSLAHGVAALAWGGSIPYSALPDEDSSQGASFPVGFSYQVCKPFFQLFVP